MYEELRRLATLRPVILGSASPRRVTLLQETGIEFTQVAPEIDESTRDLEDPRKYAVRLAEEKSGEVFGRITTNAVVIGCDTIVVLANKILGKPVTKADAFHTLMALSGQSHTVVSALSLAADGIPLMSGYDTTEVRFHILDNDRVWEYVATGEPMDKAGAYGIQGMGTFLVDRIEGNLDTVIGLPRVLLNRLAGEVLLKIG